MSKAAKALHFSNTDVALRDVSYDEMHSIKFAVRNSKVRNIYLAVDIQPVKKFPAFMEPKHSLPC